MYKDEIIIEDADFYEENNDIDFTNIDSVKKLNKDLRAATKILSPREARYLVDTYYQVQEQRKAAANRVRAMKELGEPFEMIQWFFDNTKILEAQLKLALDDYSANQAVGIWLRSIDGIGPVIAAGLLAYIDIGKAPTAGHIWNYAGLNPNIIWLGEAKSKKLIGEVLGTDKRIKDEHIVEICKRAKINNINRFYKLKNDKGNYKKDDVVKELSKRPWNANLKTLTWKIGQSFLKLSNKEGFLYGQLYKERKTMEAEKNERLEYREQAEKALNEKNYNKSTEAYKAYIQGKLPAGQINQRALRYATKIFLSHVHHVMYLERFKTEPPKPFAISILGHAHMIEIPNLDLIK